VRKAVDGRWIEPDKRKQLPGIGDRFDQQFDKSLNICRC